MNTYLIPKGDNYSSLIPAIPQIPTPPGVHFGTTKIFGKIKFNSSCKYNLSNQPICVNDTNKAVGFGYGLWPNAHHTWSIRLGWRVNTSGKLILVNYSYVNGKRIEMIIGDRNSFKFDTVYDFVITHDTVTKKAIVTVGDYTTVITNYTARPSTGYILKPYFGGDCPAPHDMRIELEYTIV